VTRTIQRELDIAEEYILNRLFGNAQNPQISNKIKLYLIANNIDFHKFLNEKILMIENMIKPIMLENGYLDGNKISKMLAVYIPDLQGLNLPNLRPIELVQLLDKILNLENIGNLLQKL
jgi:hypothetical protein